MWELLCQDTAEIVNVVLLPLEILSASRKLHWPYCWRFLGCGGHLVDLTASLTVHLSDGHHCTRFSPSLKNLNQVLLMKPCLLIHSSCFVLSLSGERPKPPNIN